MKHILKYIAAALLLTVPTICISAQDAESLSIEQEPVHFSKKPEIRFGWGGYPLLLESWHLLAKYDIGPCENSLNEVYRTRKGSIYTTGALMFSVDFPIKKWFSAGAVVSGNLCWQKTYDPALETRGTKYDGDLHVMGCARFKWLNRPAVNLYANIDAGLAVWDRSVIPAVQIVPIGVRFGKGHVFGFTEIGLGTMYCGGMAGIGYKF